VNRQTTNRPKWPRSTPPWSSLQPHRSWGQRLTVTTTMEVGIDIGPLQAVFQANMPSQRFNYQQRVGRAGRRGQAFSFVLTVCRSKSHDLHYFRHHEQITWGLGVHGDLVGTWGLGVMGTWGQTEFQVNLKLGLTTRSPGLGQAASSWRAR